MFDSEVQGSRKRCAMVLNARVGSAVGVVFAETSGSPRPSVSSQAAAGILGLSSYRPSLHFCRSFRGS